MKGAERKREGEQESKREREIEEVERGNAKWH